MLRLVRTVALVAALIALAVAVYRDAGAWVACKRAVISYLVFYFVSALLVLVFRGGILAESQKPSPVVSASQQNGTPPRRQGRATNPPEGAA